MALALWRKVALGVLVRGTYQFGFCKEERQLSDAAAVSDSPVQPQPLIAVRNVRASGHWYKRVGAENPVRPAQATIWYS